MRRIGRVISAMAAIPDKVPGWMQILRDTDVSCWTRLQRILHDARRWFGEGPDWLSDHVDSVRDIRHRRLSAGGTPGSDDIYLLLRWFESFKVNVLLGAAVLLVLVSTSLIYGILADQGLVASPFRSLSETLGTVAQVLGGIAAIAFAVIVFGIEFHAGRLKENAYLFRYMRGRGGFIPIAAFSLGVVGANALVPLMCEWWPASSVPLACLDGPLVVLVLGLTLWLLHRMVFSVSEDFPQGILPSLLRDYHLALDEDSCHARQMEIFKTEVEGAGLRYSPIGAHLADRQANAVIKLSIRSLGCVRDVDLSALRHLGAQVAELFPGYQGTLCLAPGDEITDKESTALVLVGERDDGGQKRSSRTARLIKAIDNGANYATSAVIALEEPDGAGEEESGQPRRPSDESLDAIRGTLVRLYRTGSPSKREVVNVLSKFQKTLVQNARSASAEDFRVVLDMESELIKQGLGRPDVATSPLSFKRERMPDLFGGLHHYRMAESVVASHDLPKVSELISFAFDVMGSAVEHRSPNLFYQAGEIVRAIYANSISDKKLADHVSEKIDSSLHGLMSRFEYRHRNEGQDTLASEMPVLRSALSWMLWLLRTAIEADRAEDTRNLHERLWEWDCDSERRYVRAYISHPVDPEMREVYDLHMALDIVVGAWCLHVLRNGLTGGNTAKELFARCAASLGTRHDILRVWETVRSRPYGEEGLAALFGALHWTFPVPTRVGVVVGGYGRPDLWVEEGLVALLLCREPQQQVLIPDWFKSPPPVWLPDQKTIRSEAAQLLADDNIGKDLLQIENGAESQKIQDVVDLCNARTCLLKRHQLREIVVAEIDPARGEVLRAEIIAEVRENRRIVPLIRNIGGIQKEATARFPSVRRVDRTPKERVIRGSSGSTLCGDVLARFVGVRESVVIAYATEKSAAPLRTLDDLRELATAVQTAVDTLASRGHRASLVFLPSPERFVQRLTGLPGWRVPRNVDLGEYYLGTWNGLQLAVWPHTDCSSITVVDAAAFFGSTGTDAAASLKVTLEDRFRESYQKWVETAEGEKDPAKIPDPSHVDAVVTLTMQSDVGIHDPMAAVRIDLDLSKLAFALQAGDKLYHRPGCSALRSDEQIEYSFFAELQSDAQPRSPCDQCHPDKWDEDTESQADGTDGTKEP